MNIIVEGVPGCTLCKVQECEILFFLSSRALFRAQITIIYSIHTHIQYTQTYSHSQPYTYPLFQACNLGGGCTGPPFFQRGGAHQGPGQGRAPLSVRKISQFICKYAFLRVKHVVRFHTWFT